MRTFDFTSEAEAAPIVAALPSEFWQAGYLARGGGESDAFTLHAPDEFAALVDDLLNGPEEAIKLRLRAYADQARRRIELGGIPFGGFTVRTDEPSQSKIVGAYLAATRDPDWTTIWDSQHPINAGQMIALGDAVQAHINKTFVRRAAIYAGIEAGEITTEAQIDGVYAA